MRLCCRKRSNAAMGFPVAFLDLKSLLLVGLLSSAYTDNVVVWFGALKKAVIHTSMLTQLIAKGFWGFR